MLKLRSWGLVAVFGGLLLAPFPTSASAAPVATPPGYRIVREEALHPGVHHVEFAKDDDPQRVHVAAVDTKAGARVVPVLSSEQVSGPAPRLERTSAMCARVSCVVAINADFAHPDTDEAVGAFAAEGELKRSPVKHHHQLSFDAAGRGFAGLVTATIRVVATDLSELATPHLNVTRTDQSLVLYTPTYGKTTGTNAAGAEIVGRVVKPKGALRIGQNAVIELEELRDGAGDSAIPRKGVVLSGHGAAADQLRELWRKVKSGMVASQVLVRVDTSPNLTDTVGGAPVLVRNGQRFVADDGTPFFHDRHPRTLVGWTAAGTLLLVTADGRQPGYALGLSLPEAADLMLGLGAVEAINLDGGGSTTFVSRGQVANRPSDQLVERDGMQQIVSLLAKRDRVLGAVERETVSALAIVIWSDDPATDNGADGTFAIELPVTTVDQPVATDAAAGASPEPALPAVVGVVATPSNHAVLSMVAVSLLSAVAAGTAITWRKTRICG